MTIPVAVSKEHSGSVVVATRDESGRAIATLDAMVLLAGFIAGCVLRWWVLQSRLGYLDLDEATVGLQARWFSNTPMVFFPGQAYGGTLETMLVWILHGIRADGPIAMKLVPSLLHLVAAVIVWRIALRLIDSRAGQLAAPILLWCGSGWTVWQSTKERGFYGVGLVLATLLVLLAMRFVESDATGDALAFGIAIGLAVWTTPLLVLVALPCGAWIVVRRPSVLRKLPVIAAAAAVGALPWLAWNVRHGFESFEQTQAFAIPLVDRALNGVNKLPAILGATYAPDPLPRPPGWPTLFTVMLLVVLVGIAHYRTRARAPGLLATLIVGYLAVYPTLNATVTVGGDLRYLYFLTPWLALAVAALLPEVSTPRGRALLAATVVAGATVASSVALARLNSMAGSSNTNLSRPGLESVIDRLLEEDVDFAITDIAGNQITYLSHGRIEASSFAFPRFPHLERLALRRHASTYVLYEHSAYVDQLVDHLERTGTRYRIERHGSWVVVSIERWVPPWHAELREVFTGEVVRPPR